MKAMSIYAKLLKSLNLNKFKNKKYYFQQIFIFKILIKIE